MSDKITTLHPVGDPNTNVYPNIKNENFPNNVNFSNTKVPLTTASKNYFMLLDDNGNAYKSLFSIVLNNYSVGRTNTNNTFTGVNTFENTTYFNGTTFFEETATFNDVIFNGEINFNDNIVFSSTITFGGSMQVNDNMTISDTGGITNYGETDIRGSLYLGNDAKSYLINLIYPVGSIYISANDVNPSTLFGGTWEQIRDKFLLGSGGSYSVGSSGGEANHILTVDEMPTHVHTGIEQGDGVPYGRGDSGSTNCLKIGNGYGSSTPIASYGDHTNSQGGGQAHNNMPPYLVVSIWKRTA